MWTEIQVQEERVEAYALRVSKRSPIFLPLLPLQGQVEVQPR